MVLLGVKTTIFITVSATVLVVSYLLVLKPLGLLANNALSGATKKDVSVEQKRIPHVKKTRLPRQQKELLFVKHTSYKYIRENNSDISGRDFYATEAIPYGLKQRMNLDTPNNLYLSEIIPMNIRNKPADGTECMQYFVHHNYGDGFGHQLCDIAAAMVYHLLNKQQTCFLGIMYDEGKHKQFDHNCDSCIHIYNALSGQWPGISQAAPNRSIDKFNTTRLWHSVLEAGGEKKDKFVPCYRCDIARMTVAKLWVDVVNIIAAKRSIPKLDIVIHIRKGDFPRKVSQTYAEILDNLFKGVAITIITENLDEAGQILSQLNQTHKIFIRQGEDAVEDWLIMAKAKVLFLHESSFSISASIASEGIIFSQSRKPYNGRYDNHHFPCKIEGGWWASTGLHGNTTCDVEKLRSLSNALVKKYSHGSNF